MNFPKTLFAAVIATGVMTLFMFLAPYLGLPNMDVGKLLGTLFGDKPMLGWVLHFAIGIIFAYTYVSLFNNMLPIENNISRGAIYGIGVFLFSQIMFTLINVSGFLKWEQKENMGLMVFGSAIVCIIYGAVLGVFFNKTK